jgi:hypothetical protein
MHAQDCRNPPPFPRSATLTLGRLPRVHTSSTTLMPGKAARRTCTGRRRATLSGLRESQTQTRLAAHGVAPQCSRGRSRAGRLVAYLSSPRITIAEEQGFVASLQVAPLRVMGCSWGSCLSRAPASRIPRQTEAAPQWVSLGAGTFEVISPRCHREAACP